MVISVRLRHLTSSAVPVAADVVGAMHVAGRIAETIYCSLSMTFFIKIWCKRPEGI